MELSDVYLRKVSLRKAGVYIERLPPESSTMTAIRNDSPETSRSAPVDPNAPARAPWSSDQMLTAQVIEELRLLRYSVDVFAAGKNAGSIPPPENVVRPGVKAPEGKKRKTLTPEQRRALDPRLRPETGHTF